MTEFDRHRLLEVLDASMRITTLIEPKHQIDAVSTGFRVGGVLIHQLARQPGPEVSTGVFLDLDRDVETPIGDADIGSLIGYVSPLR